MITEGVYLDHHSSGDNPLLGGFRGQDAFDGWRNVASKLLAPAVDAGVDLFDCSQRRFWEQTYKDSDLNLAGWVKKMTGVPTMTVGSIGLDCDLLASLGDGQTANCNLASLDQLMERFARQCAATRNNS